MSLDAGTPLGPYEILAPLGAGGMGEVYRARDTRLQRDVALKVIANDAIADADSLARFEQEARATAALNHPNIVAVFDIGQSDSGPFIVSELLDGETLRERLARGRVSLRTALEIGAQVARGLAAAHDKGIVHRDLKPENIFLTKDGTPKILDFGLAKLREDDQVREAAASVATVTMQSPARTAKGVVMGTVGYMAPEQVRGEAADHRADIFALGCVIYELLAGQRAFSGPTPVETMHAILTADPAEVTASGSVSVSPGAERIVRRCIEKDAAQRFQSARDLAFALEALLESRSSGSVAAAPALSSRAAAMRFLPWVVAAGLAVVLGYTLWPESEPRKFPRLQFEIQTPPANSNNQIALSPAGTHLVAVISENGGTLWVRGLETLSEQRMPGTEDAQWPFWSPDGQSIGFFADGKLKRVDPAVGTPQSIADASNGTGGSWNRDGVIVFAPEVNGPLFRVSAAGGVATPLTRLSTDRAEVAHRHPWFLPDGRHFIFVAVSTNNQQSGIYVASLDSPEATFLVQTPYRAAFAPPNGLLFLRNTTLMAQHFDPERLQLSGDPFPVAEGIPSFGVNSAAGLTVAENGMLAYRQSAGDLRSSALKWFDRSGQATAAVELLADYLDPGLSPDGRRIIVEEQLKTGTADASSDLWIIDPLRGTNTRFTFDEAIDWGGRWSPDGSKVAFSRTVGAGGSSSDLYVKDASGVTPEEVVLKSDGRSRRVTDWSPDGRFLLFSESGEKSVDLWALPLDGDRKPQPVVQSPFDDSQGRFTPDGKWIAYRSAESGRREIYVIEFPKAKSRIQVSTAGGVNPRWRGDGKELFFSNGRSMMAVDVSTSSSGDLLFGVPHKLFDVVRNARGEFDVSRDGQRFLMTVPNDAAATTDLAERVRVILNWAK